MKKYSLLPQQKLGEYTLLERIGSGGFGEVWKAKKEDFFFALKIPFFQESPERWRKEGENLQKLSHPHIIRCEAVHFEEDPPFLVLEYAEGGDLRKRLLQPNRLSLEELSQMLYPLLDALEYAHQEGILHLDLKPENLLLQEGKIKITDFGLVPLDNRSDGLLLSAGLQSSEISQISVTLAYLAPEGKKQGEKKFTPASDIFSLGVLLFEILTGSLPSGLNLPSEVAPHLNKKWDGLLKKTLSHNLEGRFPDIPSFREELKRILPLPPTSSKPPFAMAVVPAGTFIRGGTRQKEAPWQAVYLDEYRISLYPVTNQEYFQFLLETGHQPPPHLQRKRGSKVVYFEPYLPPEGKDLPVVNVTYTDACQYAGWKGARLPTEAEWEKAARGSDGKIYPWGNEFREDACHCSPQATSPVSVFSTPQGKSPYGCFHMCGNVWEWCQDFYDPNYYEAAPRKNPPGPEKGECRIIRGGSYSSPKEALECSYRAYLKPSLFFPYVGFRLVVKEKKDL